MTRQEAALLASKAAKEAHGIWQCPTCLHIHINYEYYAENGHKGGESTFKKYGPEEMARRGRLSKGIKKPRG